MLILALNVGSSSIKSAVFEASSGEERRVFAGTITNADGRWLATATAQNESTHEEPVQGAGVDSAIAWLLARLEHDGLAAHVAAVGHRLVHGGQRYRDPVWLSSDVVADLERLVSLAPDHLAIELAAVRQVSERWPRVPASGSFDTAFHASLPDRARLFGIPRQLSDAGVVRYGFHGLSYEYVVDELRRAKALESRLVVAHLGSGASLAAIGEGASIDTTMGLTPTGGIIMATRSGDLDPGVLFYLARTRGFDLPALSRVVNIDGGLRGLSGTTGDMRTLLDCSSHDPRAATAVDVFCYHVSKAVASLAVALGGLDTLVFTGGIGEHAADVRHQVCERLAWCGVTVDNSRNTVNAPVVSPADARVTVRVVPTNEEIILVRHTRALLQQGGDRD